MRLVPVLHNNLHIGSDGGCQMRMARHEAARCVIVNRSEPPSSQPRHCPQCRSHLGSNKYVPVLASNGAARPSCCSTNSAAAPRYGSATKWCTALPAPVTHAGDAHGVLAAQARAPRRMRAYSSRASVAHASPTPYSVRSCSCVRAMSDDSAARRYGQDITPWLATDPRHETRLATHG